VPAGADLAGWQELNHWFAASNHYCQLLTDVHREPYTA